MLRKGEIRWQEHLLNWDEQHERMSRGITLTRQEIESVVEAFQNESE